MTEPYTVGETKEFLGNGSLLPSDLGFTEGMQDWAQLSSIAALNEPVKPRLQLAARSAPAGPPILPSLPMAPVAEKHKKRVRSYEEDFPTSEAKGIVTVGTLYYFSALLSALSGLGLGQALLVEKNGAIVLICTSLVTVVFVVGYSWVGFAVRKRQKWAAQSCVVGAVLMLLAFPVGTVIGGYILILLQRAWGYFDLPRSKSHKDYLLSIAIPGLGQFLRGEKLKGILWFIGILGLAIGGFVFARKTLRIPSGSNGFWFYACILGMGLCWARMIIDAAEVPQRA